MGRTGQVSLDRQSVFAAVVSRLGHQKHGAHTRNRCEDSAHPEDLEPAEVGGDVAARYAADNGAARKKGSVEGLKDEALWLDEQFLLAFLPVVWGRETHHPTATLVDEKQVSDDSWCDRLGRRAPEALENPDGQGPVESRQGRPARRGDEEDYCREHQDKSSTEDVGQRNPEDVSEPEQKDVELTNSRLASGEGNTTHPEPKEGGGKMSYRHKLHQLLDRSRVMGEREVPYGQGRGYRCRDVVGHEGVEGHGGHASELSP